MVSDEWLEERLSEWRAPQPTEDETARLVSKLMPFLPAPSTVRRALRPVPESLGDQLVDMLRAVGTQASMFTRGFWVGSAAVMALGLTLLLLGFDPGGGLVVYLVGPLLSYLGCALGFRATRVGTLEFELACPISPRQLTLARLVIILGYDLLLALACAVPFGLLGTSGLLELALRWLGPLLLGAGLTLALSLRVPVGGAAALVYGAWVALVLLLAIQRGGADLGLGAGLAMIPLGIALLGLVVIVMPGALVRSLGRRPRTSSDVGT